MIAAYCCRAQTLPLIVTNITEARTLGTALVQEILAVRPASNAMISGIMKIRTGGGEVFEAPIQFRTTVTETNWISRYEISPRTTSSNSVTPHELVIYHDGSSSNRYEFTFFHGGDPGLRFTKGRSDVIAKMNYYGDFAVVDLGLEFFSWPEQRLVKKELRRSRSCRVLESINPNPAPQGYSRVVSWIDRETLGIIFAEAYDARGKLLKEFSPKDFTKVNGQWQLQGMEMRNMQTGSRTRIEFDLNNGDATK